MFGDESLEPRTDGVAYLAEYCWLITGGSSGGIDKVVVNALPGAPKDGAGFAGVVADGDDVVEGLSGELVDGL